MGLKARFGHPNMCNDALGTYLGRFKNFRKVIEETKEGKRYHAVADLHLDESAKDTPNGNLFDYVLSLAKTSPDMFGTSIVFRRGDTEYKKEKDAEGNEIEKPYATMKTLHAADLVDEPAATDSLFNKDSFASIATRFLDENPSLYELLNENENILDEFMSKYKEYKQVKNENQNEMNEDLEKKLSSLKEWVADKFQAKTEEEAPEIEENNEELEKKFEVEKAEEIAAKENEFKAELETKENEFKASLEAKEKELKELSAKVEELEKELSLNNAKPTEVDAEGDHNVSVEEIKETPLQKELRAAMSAQKGTVIK